MSDLNCELVVNRILAVTLPICIDLLNGANKKGRGS